MHVALFDRAAKGRARVVAVQRHRRHLAIPRNSSSKVVLHILCFIHICRFSLLLFFRRGARAVTFGIRAVAIGIRRTIGTRVVTTSASAELPKVCLFVVYVCVAYVVFVLEEELVAAWGPPPRPPPFQPLSLVIISLRAYVQLARTHAVCRQIIMFPM